MDSRLIIDVIRHGRTTSNEKPGFIGGTESEPLTEQGRGQISILAERYRRAKTAISLVASSNLLRARQSADIFRDRVPANTNVFPELREIERGAFGGKFWKDLPLDTRERMDAEGADFRPPGGETQREVATRMMSVLDALHEIPRRGRVILFSHATSMRCLKSAVEGTLDAHADLSKVIIDNGGIMRLLWNSKRKHWVMVGFNLTHP